MTPLPLWFWGVWQIIGLGLMAFGAVTLVLALKEWKREKAEVAVECKKGGNESGECRGSDRQNPGAGKGV